jgi:hypothetical protein
LPWTALFVSVSCVLSVWLARRWSTEGAVMLICAGWLPQFGWRGAAGLGMSGVTGGIRLSIGVSRVSSTLPSHQDRAGNGTRLFIRPWLFLLYRGGEGPTPAGQFPGHGNVGDDPAFVPGFELPHLRCSL